MLIFFLMICGLHFCVSQDNSTQSVKETTLKMVFDVIVPQSFEEDLPPIIFIHGMLDSKLTWKFVAPKIAESTGRKVYTLDCRNHGDSPWSDAYHPEILTDDLERFLLEQNISKSILLGHSMGGRMAMLYACRKPEAVEKLIVEDASPANITTMTSRIFKVMLSLSRQSLSAIPPGSNETTAAKAIAAFFDGIPLAESLPPMEKQPFPLAKNGTTYYWKTNLKAVDVALGPRKLWHKFSGSYSGEAFFLYGVKSLFKVDDDSLIWNYFPRATKLGFEGAGHLVHTEFPEAFSEEVIKFITGRMDPASSCGRRK